MTDKYEHLSPAERKFLVKCDEWEPKILAYIASCSDRRIWLKQLVRHFFVEDENSDYHEIGEIAGYVTLDLQSRGILFWDKDMKLTIKEN